MSRVKSKPFGLFTIMNTYNAAAIPKRVTVIPSTYNLWGNLSLQCKPRNGSSLCIFQVISKINLVNNLKTKENVPYL